MVAVRRCVGGVRGCLSDVVRKLKVTKVLGDDEEVTRAKPRHLTLYPHRHQIILWRFKLFIWKLTVEGDGKHWEVTDEDDMQQGPHTHCATTVILQTDCMTV